MKAFIFDLDGVLVFTDRFHFLAWKEEADRLGIEFNEKINDRLRGVSRADSLEIILGKYHGPAMTQEMKAGILARKNDAYRKMLGTMTEEDVSPEVRETLKMLREAGYLLAIGSSSRNTKYILEKVKLSEAFDAVSDGTNIERSKPDPQVFLMAAQFLKTEPRECYVVEDADAGIEAAKAGGMTAVGIGPAAAYGRTDIPIASFSELLKLI